MSNQVLKSRSALAAPLSSGRAQVEFEVLEGMTVAHVAARKGKCDELRKRLAAHLGMDAPLTPNVATSGTTAIVWAGPEQWLVLAPATDGRDLERELSGKLAGVASVSDQSDARTIVMVQGPKARATLAKGLPIDLHPRAFPAKSAAITHAAHIGVTIWHPDDDDRFVVACSRSYAASFWHWLLDAGKEFGTVVY